MDGEPRREVDGCAISWRLVTRFSSSDMKT
jgi:hypothetical protein